MSNRSISTVVGASEPARAVGVGGKMVTLYYNDFTLLDYAYLDPLLGIVGNSLRVSMELTGLLDEEGVIFDFSNVKKLAKKIVDDYVDHTLVVPKGIVKHCSDVSKTGQTSNWLELEYSFENESKVLNYTAPQGICEVEESSVTPAAIQVLIERKLKEKLSPNVRELRIILTQQPDVHNSFRYTHGLKKHYGNCQRLLHGHMSYVYVKRNGHEDKELERYIAQDFFKGNVRFVTKENVKGRKEVYVGNQGFFDANTLNLTHCLYIETEGTVENLALYVLNHLKTKFGPDSIYDVVLTEGLDKGAKVRG